MSGQQQHETVMTERKIHPRSLENLTHEGRPKIHGEKKTAHNVSVTPTGWQGAQAAAAKLGFSSVSELIEQLGRQQVRVERESGDDRTVQLSEVKNELKNLLESTCKHLISEITAKVTESSTTEPVPKTLVVGKTED
jgi:hypothetical protein